MLKKIGFPLIALLAILVLIPASHAQAGVRIGVGIGVPAYPAYPAYGYAAPYGYYGYPNYYSYPYPAYSYPYPAPVYPYAYGYYGRRYGDYRGYGYREHEGRDRGRSGGYRGARGRR